MDYTTGTVMDTLKKKMRQAKLEMANSKEAHEHTTQQLAEVEKGREAVSENYV